MILDAGLGQCPLKNAAAAEIIQSSLTFHRDSRYRLFAWCIMPNHVHAAIEMLPGYRIGDVVKSWKSYSARRINSDLGTSGSFWARDYFDRYMRNEHQFAATIDYILDNPVKAGLVCRAEDWPWSSAFHCEPGGSRS